MGKKILIYNSGGGLGDAIQLFPLILTLQNHFATSEFYYQDSLGAKYFSNELKDYNIKIKNLNLNLKHFGFRWWHYFKAKSEFLKLKLDIDKFDLIIDIQSKIRNTLILKKLPNNHFYSSTFNYFFCSIKKKYSDYENVNQRTISNLEKFYGTTINRINYNLELLNDKFIKESIKLLPGKNYIGLSITHGNPYRKKHWPINKFVELAVKLEKKGKKPIFFVEKSNNEIINKIKSIIPNAFFPEHASELASPALVTALASRLEKAISIDNGIMHMISLAQIPMLVLFGPTKPEKFAPNQKNINIIDSKKLYNTKDISKITVEDILKHVF